MSIPRGHNTRILHVKFKHSGNISNIKWCFEFLGCNSGAMNYELHVIFNTASEISEYSEDILNSINPGIKFNDIYVSHYSGALKYMTPGCDDLLMKFLLLHKAGARRPSAVLRTATA